MHVIQIDAFRFFDSIIDYAIVACDLQLILKLRNHAVIFHITYITKSRNDFAMVYKSSVDFPSKKKAIDESCVDFIYDIPIDFFFLQPLAFAYFLEVGLQVENEKRLAADSRVPDAVSVIADASL